MKTIPRNIFNLVGTKAQSVWFIGVCIFIGLGTGCDNKRTPQPISVPTNQISKPIQIAQTARSANPREPVTGALMGTKRGHPIFD